MLCAVPIGGLRPLEDAFLFENGGGGIDVGIVLRQAHGYTQVMYTPLNGAVRHHSFRGRDGEQVQFDESGSTTTEWSTKTLVRPIVEEDEMGDAVSGLVSDSQAVDVAKVKDKVQKLKAKGTVKASGLKGKLAAKGAPKVKKEKAEKVLSPCRCACGTETGGTFAPGHDARYFGWLKKVADGRMEFKELPKSLQKEFVDIRGVKKALAASKH